MKTDMEYLNRMLLAIIDSDIDNKDSIDKEEIEEDNTLSFYKKD